MGTKLILLDSLLQERIKTRMILSRITFILAVAGLVALITLVGSDAKNSSKPQHVSAKKTGSTGKAKKGKEDLGNKYRLAKERIAKEEGKIFDNHGKNIKNINSTAREGNMMHDKNSKKRHRKEQEKRWNEVTPKDTWNKIGSDYASSECSWNSWSDSACYPLNNNRYCEIKRSRTCNLQRGRQCCCRGRAVQYVKCQPDDKACEVHKEIPLRIRWSFTNNQDVFLDNYEQFIKKKTIIDNDAYLRQIGK